MPRLKSGTLKLDTSLMYVCDQRFYPPHNVNARCKNCILFVFALFNGVLIRKSINYVWFTEMIFVHVVAKCIFVFECLNNI